MKRTFIDLGMSPLCEAYPSIADLNRAEVCQPPHVCDCEKCFQRLRRGFLLAQAGAVKLKRSLGGQFASYDAGGYISCEGRELR
jgi:hypothetical protein